LRLEHGQRDEPTVAIRRTTTFVIAALVLFARSSLAHAAPTKNEAACQQQAARQLGTAALKRIKCLVACDKQALKGKVPEANCLPPYAGPTRTCVDTVVAKAAVAIDKKCDVDCPECWSGGDCDEHVPGLLSFVETTLDDVVPFVRCDDAMSTDGLTKAEAKARQKIATTIGTYTLGTEKCLATCRAGQSAGKIPAGACDGLGTTDPKGLACLIKVGDKTFDALNDPKLDLPECLEDVAQIALPYVSGIIDELDPELFCASPSGAFLQNDIFE
jgi:hypothetical protein